MFETIKRNIPLISLILLSPLIAELLSGSSPPREFFNPIGFLLLVGLYGSGVLIIRELCVKWEKGWGSILTLGMAYGIMEEGLAVTSFFNPNWVDLGNLGTYGRWLDVNWVWSVWLTIFHTIFSIALPILIFKLLFPNYKEKRLISDKKLDFVIIIFIIVIGIDFRIFSNFPNLFWYILSIIIVISLFGISKKVRPDILRPKNIEPLLSPIWFGIVGFIFTLSMFIINYSLTYIIAFPIIPILLDISEVLLILLFIIIFSGYENNTYHKHAFTCGLLSFFIFLAFIQETNGMLGMSIVGIFFILFLIYLRKRIKKYSIIFYPKDEHNFK